MRAPAFFLLGPALVTACTLENPAFLVGASGPDAPAATTSSGSGAATGDPPDTGAPATDTGEPATASATATAGATGDASTGTPPADTTGTTDPVGDTTGDPGDTETTGDTTNGDTTTGDTTTGGDPLCELPDPLGPLAKVLDSVTNEHLKYATCDPWDGLVYVAKLKPDPQGFVLAQDMLCGPKQVPADLRITVPIPQGAKALNACVSIKFGLHPDGPECHLSWLQIDQGRAPALFGRFGSDDPSPLPDVTVTPHKLPGCPCDGCCGAEQPDPGAYDLLVNDTPVPEGSDPLVITAGPKKYAFLNLRSHIHDQCADDQYAQPDWLHIDWILARTQ